MKKTGISNSGISFDKALNDSFLSIDHIQETTINK